LFAPTPDARPVPDAKPGFLRPAESAAGAVPEVARRRLEASAGGLPRRALAWAVVGAAVEAVRPAAGEDDTGVETGPGDRAGAAGAADAGFGSTLPRSARLAREVGAFGGAVGSTGLVILSVIRAMGQGSARPAATASHHSGRVMVRARHPDGKTIRAGQPTPRWRGRTPTRAGHRGSPAARSGQARAEGMPRHKPRAPSAAPIPAKDANPVRRS
jgi:hypothetical protein